MKGMLSKVSRSLASSICPDAGKKAYQVSLRKTPTKEDLLLSRAQDKGGSKSRALSVPLQV